MSTAQDLVGCGLRVVREGARLGRSVAVGRAGRAGPPPLALLPGLSALRPWGGGGGGWGGGGWVGRGVCQRARSQEGEV